MGENKYLLDSNFIIYYLSGAEFAINYFDEIVDNELYLSVISKIEVLSFSSYAGESDQDTRLFLEPFQIVPLDGAVEDLTVAFRRVCRRKLPDAIIAASAVHIGATLVTSDRQLAKATFPGLRVVNPMSL